MPGYTGFVPGVKTGNLIGKTYTEHTRDMLTKEKLDDRSNVFATTGYVYLMFY